jgi:PKD repeat protein
MSRSLSLLLTALLCLFAAGSLSAAPNAPSNLRIVSQTWNSFTFAWNDNAADETSQPIYLSEGGGAFYQLTAFRANSTQAQLAHLTTNRIYRIYLTARNAAGESGPSNTLEVFIPTPDPVARFSWSPASPTTDTPVVFSNASTGLPTSSLWEFGDGTTSTAWNPTKQYKEPGRYEVSLTVRRGTASATTSQTITVAAGSPGLAPLEAAFDCGNCSGVSGVEILFEDRSTGSPESWSWDFGDGTLATGKNVAHRYAAAGAFTVTLTASRGSQSSQVSRSVVIASPPVDARRMIPGVIRAGGSGGSLWRSELTLTNGGQDDVTLDLRLLTGSGAVDRKWTVFAQQTSRFDDVVFQLFGLDSAAGALVLSAPAEKLAALLVESRTFTVNTDGGTFGQRVPAESLPASTTGWLRALRSDGLFRTNIGLVNASASRQSVALTLVGAGAEKRIVVELGPDSWQQHPLGPLFSLEGMESNLTVRLEASSPDVVVYGSVVDASTQDPAWIAAAMPLSAGQAIVPVVGRTAGANGTFWRSDLELTNPGTADVSVSLSFFGHSSPASKSDQLVVAAGSTVRLNDVLSILGSESGSGALEVTWTGGEVIVGSRTFTSAGGGTYGQDVDARGVEPRSDAVVTALRQDAAFRSNVGLVNAGSTTLPVLLRLFDATGASLGTAVVSLGPRSHSQQPLPSLFPGVSFSSGSFVVTAQVAEPSAFVLYASVIDAISGDPLFLAGGP